MGLTQRVKWSSIAGMAMMLVALVVPVPASADEGQGGYWMAAAGAEATVSGLSWGRLGLHDGMLVFHSAQGEWATRLADIKRIEISKAAAQTLEIETVAGRVLYIAILDRQLLRESPRKAMQTIQRAVRETPRGERPAPAAAAVVAGGGSVR